jgi:hypothetical protein
MLYDITGTTASLFLFFGRRLLLQFLKALDGAKVRMPPLGDINEYTRVIVDKYPSLEGVWFVVDGLKLMLEQARNCSIQSTVYKGRIDDHYVTINNPGNVHDSQAAEQGGAYDKLEEQHLITGD